MNDKNRNSKGSGTVTLAILAGILLFNLFSAKFKQEDMSVVFFSTLVVVFITAVVVAVSKLKAGKNDGKKQTAVPLNRPFPQPTAVKNRRPAILQHKDEAEEAISCGHKSGKEKYLEQVEGFYKNGLIDRAEYKILREKYEKLEMPEDYH